MNPSFLWPGLLLVQLLGTPVPGLAQHGPAGPAPVPAAAGDSLAPVPRYQQVVPVPGASADELYFRARRWVGRTFEDAHQVLQLEDAPHHVLLGSGYTQAQARRSNGTRKPPVPLWFRFEVETREGRYRVELTDFGAVREFSANQYAASGIAYWLADGHATQAASHRHSAPGQGLDASVQPDQQVREAIDRAANELLASLGKAETAAPVTW